MLRDVCPAPRTPDFGVAKVAGIIGTYQVEKTARLPGRILACRSYIYDEQQLRVRFVHVLFRNEKLVSATDGHVTTCKI